MALRECSIPWILQLSLPVEGYRWGPAPRARRVYPMVMVLVVMPAWVWRDRRFEDIEARSCRIMLQGRDDAPKLERANEGEGGHVSSVW